MKKSTFTFFILFAFFIYECYQEHTYHVFPNTLHLMGFILLCTNYIQELIDEKKS